METAESFIEQRRAEQVGEGLARAAGNEVTSKWLDALTAEIVRRRAEGLPSDGRKTRDAWLEPGGFCERVTASQLALLIADVVLRPRDQEPSDATARELPSVLTVAGDLGTALGVTADGADRHAVRWLRVKHGLGLLSLAAHVGFIEPLQLGIAQGENYVNRESPRVQLTAQAAEEFAAIYTTLSVANDLRAEQVVFDPPPPTVSVTPNVLGLQEVPDNNTPGVVAVIDALQRTPWRINTVMLARVVGVKNPMIEVRRADKVLRKIRHQWRWAPKKDKPTLVPALNAARKDLRHWLAVVQAQALADAGRPFYYRCRLDYRGRIYQVGGLLTYTGGDDLVRSLLEFADGDTPDTFGAAMLSVHMTSLYGNGADKLPLAQRMNWARSIPAGEPAKPYRFQAALESWNALRKGGKVHVPCAIDCTASGLQHYAFLMRDAALGTLVNACKDPAAALEAPRDIYQQIATTTGETRDTVKKLGNPQIYGAGPDLQTQILAERLGEPVTPELAARAMRVRETLEALAPAFCKVSKWLGTVVKGRAEGLQWRLPDGFTVLQDSRRQQTTQIALYVFGSKDPLRYSRSKATEAIWPKKQSTQIAANLIHSLDAAFLREVVRLGTAAGITHWAIAHDSFGVPASQALLLQSVLRPALDALYSGSMLTELGNQWGVANVPEHAQELPAAFRHGQLVT